MVPVFAAGVIAGWSWTEGGGEVWSEVSDGVDYLAVDGAVDRATEALDLGSAAGSPLAADPRMRVTWRRCFAFCEIGRGLALGASGCLDAVV